MFFKISGKKLSEINDPYDSNPLNIEPPITKDEMKLALYENNIFESKEKSERENYISKIAFLISNKEYIKIKINEEKQIETDFTHLYAATFYEDENVVVTIDSNDLSEELNVTNISNHENKPHLKKIYEWKNIHSEEYNKWKDKNFIHKNFSYSISEKRADTYKFVHDEVWKDSDFLTKMLITDNGFINNASKAFLYKDEIFDFIKENNIYMHKMFDLYIEDKGGHKTHYSIIDNDIPPETIAHIHKRFENEILEDKKQIINLVNGMTFTSYGSLPFKYQIDLDVINAYIDGYIKRKSNINPKNLPKEFFSNEDVIKKFLKEVYSKASYTDIKDYENFYSSWINDKNKIIEYSKLTKNNSNDYKNFENGKLIKANDPFLDFFEILPPNLKVDKEILAIFITKNPKIYYRLTKNLRDDKNLFLKSLSPTEDFLHNEININKLNDSIIESLTKEEIIKVVKNNPLVVLKNEKTLTWLESSDVVMLLGKIFDQITVKESVLKEVYDDEEKVLKLITDNPDIYIKLPEKVKAYNKIAGKYLVMYPSYIKSIPKRAFNSIEFCANALIIFKTSTDKVVELMPKGIWEDPNFILKVAEKIDSNKLPLSIFNSYAKDIANILNTNTEHTKIESVKEYLEKYMMQLNLNQNLQTERKSIRRNKI